MLRCGICIDGLTGCRTAVARRQELCLELVNHDLILIDLLQTSRLRHLLDIIEDLLRSALFCQPSAVISHMHDYNDTRK